MYFRLLFETKHRNIEFLNQIVIDTRLYNLEDKKIYAVIINTIDANPESCDVYLGTIRYETETVRVNGDKNELLINELKRKINMEEKFDDQDKVDLILYPLMDKSEFILERTLKIIDLVKDIKNREQRIVFLGAIVGVAEKYLNREEVQRFKEALMTTEIGYMIRQEGVKDGIKECICTVLLNKFETIQDDIYDKINGMQDEKYLREYLIKAVNCSHINELCLN